MVLVRRLLLDIKFEKKNISITGGAEFIRSYVVRLMVTKNLGIK